MAPRPGVNWNVEAGFVILDAQVAAAGITTVLDSLAIGTRPDAGFRGGARGIATPYGRSIVWPITASLRLASVMDHTPGQRQCHDPAKWRQYQECNGKWSDEKMEAALIELSDLQARNAPARRRGIVERWKSLGVPVASHDDLTVEHVEEAVGDGVAISEFPTTLAAARAAREHRLATVMGAPNVVRGGSHSGSVSLELAKAGLLDIRSSDYVPSSLMIVAFQLVRDAGCSLPPSIDTVSWAPAQAVGLHDRGAIKVDLRADMVRVGLSGALPAPRATYVRGARAA
ncbi:alpha-D-ribose 1-methylphosphonate 5-triphosphate diphosphatase [Paraburkholderia youngii]